MGVGDLGDLKLRHLARDPRCVLVVFKAVRPFRGVEVRGVSELVECDVSSVRAAIAGRYLGVGDGARFAASAAASTYGHQPRYALAREALLHVWHADTIVWRVELHR